MNDRLHEIIAQCAVIHNTNIQDGIIKDLDEVEDRLNGIDSDVKEHYLTLLMQYYFQQNYRKGLEKLLLQGYKFELRFEDIKEAFLHITKDKECVIEFFEDHVVMLKDVVQDEDLKAMYDFYQSSPLKDRLDESLVFIKKNRYVCAKAHKIQTVYSNFFVNEDLLELLQRDLPYLLK